MSKPYFVQGRRSGPCCPSSSSDRLVAFTLQGGQIIVPGVGAYDLDQIPFALALLGSLADYHKSAVLEHRLMILPPFARTLHRGKFGALHNRFGNLLGVGGLG